MAPTDESSWTNYVCQGCGAFFHLTGRDVEEALAKGDVGSNGIGGTLVFRCQECNELKAVRAEKCPRHGVIIKLSPGPDDPAACPECVSSRQRVATTGWPCQLAPADILPPRHRAGFGRAARESEAPAEPGRALA